MTTALYLAASVIILIQGVCLLMDWQPAWLRDIGVYSGWFRRIEGAVFLVFGLGLIAYYGFGSLLGLDVIRHVGAAFFAFIMIYSLVAIGRGVRKLRRWKERRRTEAVRLRTHLQRGGTDRG